MPFMTVIWPRSSSGWQVPQGRKYRLSQDPPPFNDPPINYIMSHQFHSIPINSWTSQQLMIHHLWHLMEAMALTAPSPARHSAPPGAPRKKQTRCSKGRSRQWSDFDGISPIYRMWWKFWNELGSSWGLIGVYWIWNGILMGIKRPSYCVHIYIYIMGFDEYTYWYTSDLRGHV